MGSNFDFLKNEWPILSNIGETAEKTLNIDPNLTLIKTRQLGEKIAIFIMKFENIKQFEKMNFSERLQQIKREDWIDKNIIDIFYLIKNLGNRAAHENYGSEKDGDLCLSFSLKLSAWFHSIYSRDINFDPTKIVYKKTQFLDKTEQYKAEIEYLNREYKSLKKEFDNYKIEDSKRDKKDKIISLERYKKIKLTERETRVLIDQQLKNSGWVVDSENITYSKGYRAEKGKNIAISEYPVKGNKRVDYALFIGLEFVGVIEAKRGAKDIYSILDSDSKYYSRYAKIFNNEKFVDGAPFGEYKIPFMFATNGRGYIKQLETKSGIWFFDGRDKYNHPKVLKNWPTPQNIKSWLKKDIIEAENELKNESFEYLESKNGLNLRKYQIEAVKSVENAIIAGKDKVLLTMATGTGKTRTAIALLYRLLKAKRFNRVLFVVDRRALGIQAFSSFKDGKIENFQSFTDIYDIKEIDKNHIEDTTKIDISTIQSVVKRVIYGEEKDKPGVADYDCIVIDEAHRGYFLDKEIEEYQFEYKDQNDYISKYRAAVEYFDAVKIGLTATPALHTTEIFGKPVYSYGYREAVIDGFLVDHNPPYIIETKLQKEGIDIKRGEQIEVYDRYEQTVKKEEMEDDIHFDITQFNRDIVANSFNKVVLEEIFLYHIDINKEGKTLIFATNDLHADLVVKQIKEILIDNGINFDDNAVVKITGYIKNQQEMIKRFKNETAPKVVVTVDLLTTGIDIPEIVNLIFLRRVKSRILYEQMMGRATRLAPEISKDSFNIFDCVGIYENMLKFTDMKPIVTKVNSTVNSLVEEFGKILAIEEEEIEGIKKGEIIDKHRGEIFAKLQRFVKMEGVEFNSDSSIKDYIDNLKDMENIELFKKLKDDIEIFNQLDKNFKKGGKILIHNGDDEIENIKSGYGDGMKPEDYLESFKDFIEKNSDKIDALKILLTTPKKFTKKDLKEIKMELSKNNFYKNGLQNAFKESRNSDIVVDLITLIRGIADKMEFVDHQFRIERAVKKVLKLKRWNNQQKNIIELIKNQLLVDNVLTKEDFNKDGILKDQYGGFKRIDKIFKGELDTILDIIEDELYR